MRLLFVVNVYPPDVCGGASIFGDLARGLAERGVEVTVRCAYPYYPEWRDKSGKNGLAVDRYEEDGVRVERYGLYIPRNPGSLWERLLYEASFFLSLSRTLLRREPPFDAVIVVCPLMGAVAYAALRKRLYPQPVWLKVHDLPVEAAMAGRIVASGRLGRMLQRIQGWLFNQADVWNTLAPRMLEQLETYRKKDQPLFLFPDWLHGSAEAIIASFPEKIGRPPSRPVRLVYTGNIGTKQQLLACCQVLQASDAPFELRIHAGGSEAPRVRAWIERTGDPRFRMGPLLPEEEYLRLLHESDLVLITEKAGSGGSFIPSKLIPAIATHTPILAISDPDTPLGQEMRRYELGPWFSWDQLEEIPGWLKRLPELGETFTHWQQQAARRSVHYSRKQSLDRTLAILEAMVRGRVHESEVIQSLCAI